MNSPKFMNKSILEQFSFGFEIEGMFKDGMMEQLHGRFVSDGSVSALSPEFETQLILRDYNCNQCSYNSNGRIEIYCPAHHAIYRREGSSSTEYESLVYPSFEECLKDLKKFTPKTHIFNETCGLHFHIGLKGQENKETITDNFGNIINQNKLFSLGSNLDYLKSLWGNAKTWCDCQKTRLESNRAERFCAIYRDSKDLKNSTTGVREQKYRMVRFHREYNTLEFRFLCPCEHKIQNVIKLLNNFTGYLGRKETIHREAMVETEINIVPLLKIDKRLPSLKNLEFNMKLEPGINEAKLRGLRGKQNTFEYALNTNGQTGQTGQTGQYIPYSSEYSNFMYTLPSFGRFI